MFDFPPINFDEDCEDLDGGGVWKFVSDHILNKKTSVQIEKAAHNSFAVAKRNTNLLKAFTYGRKINYRNIESMEFGGLRKRWT